MHVRGDVIGVTMGEDALCFLACRYKPVLTECIERFYLSSDTDEKRLVFCCLTPLSRAYSYLLVFLSVFQNYIIVN